MEVFLLRHGTRNFTLGDVPLNEEGLQQAKDLAAMDHWEPLSGLLSSPRKRAMMTVQPIAERWGFSLSIFEDLDQVRGGEGEIEFHARVKNFIKRVEEKEFGEKVLICSHSDWLAVAAQVIPTDELDLKYKMFRCAEVVAFKIEAGLWHLKS